jgi:ABC-type Fe3+ transport system permease subunit
MFERFYQWVMRNGSPLLLLIALALFLCGFVMNAVMLTDQSGSSTFQTTHSPGGWLLQWSSVFLASFSSAVLPLFGALVIHRLDRNHRNSS